MKSKGLQELVAKVFSDEKTKLQFESDPEAVISQFTLTEQEKKAVMKTHARLGLVTSNSTQLEAAIDPTSSWFAPTP
jgi:hypothetical protein